MSWSGQFDESNQSEPSQPHQSVLSPSDPVSPAPTPGPIVFLPSPEAGSLTTATKSFQEAVKSSNATIQKEVDEETRGIIWLDHSTQNKQLLVDTLQKWKGIGWIQMPMAGVNAYSDLIKKENKRVWTSAKGAFAQPVAEHALVLTFALLRYLPERVRATSWGPNKGLSLFNRNVLIVGGGGITLSYILQIQPFNCNVMVLRRSSKPLTVPGLSSEASKNIQTLESNPENLLSSLPHADVVIIAAALTEKTRGMFGLGEFERMKKSAVLVNVARGELIKTQDLIQALKQDLIGGAALDVTDPEPLPEGHELWNFKDKNFLITPHTADTFAQVLPLLSERFSINAKALVEGSGRFVGVIDNEQGY